MPTTKYLLMPCAADPDQSLIAPLVSGEVASKLEETFSGEGVGVDFPNGTGVYISREFIEFHARRFAKERLGELVSGGPVVHRGKVYD